MTGSKTMSRSARAAGLIKAYVVMIIAGFIAKSGMDYSQDRRLTASARARRPAAALVERSVERAASAPARPSGVCVAELHFH